MSELRLHCSPCHLGQLYWVFDAAGIHGVTLAEGQEKGWSWAQHRFPGVVVAATMEVPDIWQSALLAAVEQPRLPRVVVPLVLRGTLFQQAVWAVLQKIPAGRLLTYAEVARRSGYPRAARAVGNACGANPVPFLVPCHRVVASAGRWGGYGLGLSVKEAMLWREGIVRERTISLSAHARIPLLGSENRHDLSDDQWFDPSL